MVVLRVSAAAVPPPSPTTTGDGGVAMGLRPICGWPTLRSIPLPLRKHIVSIDDLTYIPRAMKQFRVDEWCSDPYAKQCERCDIVIGRYAVMKDAQGLRQVMFWPHAAWDGVEGSVRCRAHTRLAQQWLRLF